MSPPSISSHSYTQYHRPNRNRYPYYIRGSKTGKKHFIPYGTNPPPRQTSFRQQHPSNDFRRSGQHQLSSMNRIRKNVAKRLQDLKKNAGHQRIFVDRSRNGENLEKHQPRKSRPKSSEPSSVQQEQQQQSSNPTSILKNKVAVRDETGTDKKVCVAVAIRKLYKNSKRSIIVPNIFSTIAADDNCNGLYAMSNILQSLRSFNEQKKANS